MTINRKKAYKRIAVCVLTGMSLSFFSPSDGFSKTEKPIVRFSIKTDKPIYRIGEEIIITVSAENLSGRVCYIQTLRPLLNTKLVITNPSGEKFFLEDDKGPFYPTDYSAVLPGNEIEYARLKVKSEGYNIKNKPVAGYQPFWKKGAYEISCSYQDLSPFLDKALTGTFTADSIKINIVSLREGPEITPKGISIKQSAIEKLTIKKEDAESSLATEPQEPLIGKEEAIFVAEYYFKNHNDYRKKEMEFLSVSDNAEKGFWEVGFEEKKTKIFHVVKVNEKTGEAKEVFFLE
ncbi:MAG: hypothetical protein Q8L26_06510 [Candidatus Omnitrophota bacterium]|nr:hypothetical protein [Candidatus Omnitrophota bacterium]